LFLVTNKIFGLVLSAYIDGLCVIAAKGSASANTKDSELVS
jgi:hypothetical protein